MFKQLLCIRSQGFQLFRQNYVAKAEISCTERRILEESRSSCSFLQESSLQVRLSSGTLEQEIHSKTGVVFLKRYSQFSWDFIWSGHGSQIKKYKLPADPSWIFEIRHVPHLLPVLICLFPALIALTADRHRCISCWCQKPVLLLCRSHLLGKQIHS